MNLTIHAWATWIVCTVIGLVIATLIGNVLDDDSRDKKNKHKSLWISVVGTIIISIVILIGLDWYYTHTAQGSRAFKTQRSNLENGMHREVSVFDSHGNLIKSYNGKFDIQFDQNRILFDDEHGMRHIIYYATGTVIIDEIDIREEEDGHKQNYH